MKKSILVITCIMVMFMSCQTKSQGDEKNSPAKEEVTKVEEVKVVEYKEHFTSLPPTTTTLSDPKATDNAKALFEYLNSVYGKKVLTGMMENAWDNSYNQLETVKKDTGKYPALMGFDFMDYTGIHWNAQNLQTQRAIAFWNGQNYAGKKISDNHGIVTFNWHWRDPLVEKGKTGSFRPEEAAFRIPYDTDNKKWKKDSETYKEMMKDLDVIANELLILQEAGVPVIWRPMHEGAGNVGLYSGSGVAWFWWGAGNTTKFDGEKYTVSNMEKVCAECYIALWKLMYEYFTQTKGIHNCIWLWNGQNDNFFPGSQYVDMIGVDIYARNGDYSSQKTSFMKNHKLDPSKMVTLSECGVIPSLEKMEQDDVMWSYFMVWNDGKKYTDKDNFWNGNVINPLEHRLEVYNSPYAITLDEVFIKTK